jgi:hypothetical protein
MIRSWTCFGGLDLPETSLRRRISINRCNRWCQPPFTSLCMDLICSFRRERKTLSSTQPNPTKAQVNCRLETKEARIRSTTTANRSPAIGNKEQRYKQQHQDCFKIVRVLYLPSSFKVVGYHRSQLHGLILLTHRTDS